MEAIACREIGASRANQPCLYWRSVAGFPGPDSGSGINSRGTIVRGALYGIALLVSAVRYERVALSL